MADQVQIREYYTVSLHPFTPEGNADSLLNTVRREFFEGRKAVKGNTRAVENGREVRTRYRLANGCFHWKKTCSGAILEEAFPVAGGGYRLLTHGAEGELTSVSVYDARQHWLKTIYYDGGPEHPTAVLERAESGLELQTAEGNTGLLPCLWKPGSAEQSFINAQTGEPGVTASTDAGEFCFCPAEKCALRREAQKKSQDTPDCLAPGWPESAEAALDFHPIPNAPISACQSNRDRGEEAAQDPARDYAANHEIYSVETHAAHPAKYAVAAKGLSGPVRGGLKRREEHREEQEPSKRIVISSGESYLYFGRLIDGMRQGQGRTQMSGGHTAYEGNYCDDQRDGFGVYYCKSGRLSYAGGWKKNLRDGLGVAFSHDGFIFVGNWKAGVANGVGTEFDLSGNPVRTGLWRDGKYIGPVGPADLTR
mgnify:CR=1 FL=1